MRCSDGKRFLALVKQPRDLEAKLDTLISEIKVLLCPSARPIQSAGSQFLNALGGFRFSVPYKIYEVGSNIWHLNFERGTIGAYRNGTIFLKQNSWCLKTLLHEALHSLSLFSIPTVSPFVRTYRLFTEGMTEFLTGFFLFTNHKTCHQSWKRGTFPECKITYKPKVRTWCAFCNFVGIGTINEIYFWKGQGSWNDAYEHFLKSIRNTGYPNFRDVLQPETNSEEIFIQECINQFGDSYTQILNSKRSLDYSLVLQKRRGLAALIG